MFAVICAGIAGFIVTWLSKLLSQKISWPGAPGPTSGCFSISDCPQSWWTMPLFLFVLFGPAVIYMAIAVIGFFKHWSAQRWLNVSLCAVLLTVLFYVGSDAIGIYIGWAS